jgi:ABC-type branched-subunit amino acid transport system ATPase component
MNQNSLLELRGVTKSYGALKAVNEASLAIERGQIVGLIGPNGSGKSTLLNLISGFARPDSGEIYFEGGRISGLSPDAVSRLGVVKGFQVPRNFLRMTVYENLLLSPKNQVGERVSVAAMHGRWARQEAENMKSILPWIEATKLSGNSAARASELSGGQMKLLDILRGVLAGPRLLLLDEPTAGVAPSLAEEIFKRIVEIRDKVNASFFIIEHRVETLLRFVDNVVVMDLGEVIYNGDPDDVINNERVKEVYLGQ